MHKPTPVPQAAHSDYVTPGGTWIEELPETEPFHDQPLLVLFLTEAVDDGHE